jgi:hypothetical protein
MRTPLHLVLPAAMACMLANRAVIPATRPATTPATFETGRLDRVEFLHDPVIRGAVPTFYTLGYEQHARDLQRFMTGERDFVKRQLGVDVPLSLAVLDAKQWKRVERQLPYPMPSVTGEPPVALMPANWAQGPDFFPRQNEVDPGLVKIATAHGLGWAEASHRAMDLVGGHELGHTTLDVFGIVPGTHWLNEFLASYVMYAYLQNDRRDLLWLIPVMQAICRIRQSQPHVSLDDFEVQYMQILSTEPANYSWYQGQFMAQVQAVYRRRGVSFLHEVRKVFPAGTQRFALGNEETLRRLDVIDPGFSTWARSVAALPREPQVPPAIGKKKS